MRRMRSDVDIINVIQNAKFHAWRNFLHPHDDYYSLLSPGFKTRGFLPHVRPNI